METKKRTHIVVSEELIKEVDRLTGKRKRSQFITRAIKKEIQRLSYIKAVRETSGTWEDSDHPEFSDGSESWVRTLRDKDGKRIKDK
ncbi:MAG: hypothetical protein ACQEP5_06930 [Actinomycetota bacterium]